MLKKWFIRAFPQIQKISQNLGPKLGQKLLKIKSSMKRCFGSAKPYISVFRFFERYYDAKEVIQKRISWNWENISKSGPKLGQKVKPIEYLMKRCIGSVKPHRTVFRFFARYYDAKEVIHKRISWNPENISKSGPKIRPKIVRQIESSMKRCIGSVKPHRTVFRFFARYYDAKEMIHKRISWNPENISKSWPKLRPKIKTNWIFNEKVHRIRETSQNRFSLFRKILRC